MARVVRLAQETDFADIVRLLQKANVNADGVDKPTSRFLVVENQGTESANIIGTAGVEFYGEKALLRSLVLESAGNARIGVEMIRLLLAFVQEQAMKELYLLTRASTSFFEQLGFSEIAWDQLPHDIRMSAHVQETGSEAVPMVYFVG